MLGRCVGVQPVRAGGGEGGGTRGDGGAGGGVRGGAVGVVLGREGRRGGMGWDRRRRNELSSLDRCIRYLARAPCI